MSIYSLKKLKLLRTKRQIQILLCLCFSSSLSLSLSLCHQGWAKNKKYARVTIENRTDQAQSGKVNYLSKLCKDQSYQVNAGETFTLPKRGICLVRNISVKGGSSFTSSGDAHSPYVIEMLEDGPRVYKLGKDNEAVTQGMGYKPIIIENKTTETITGTVDYISKFCKDRNYKVLPGKSWESPPRGICLVRQITTNNSKENRPPVLVGNTDYSSQTYSYLYFTSPGTSSHHFAIYPVNMFGYPDYMVKKLTQNKPKTWDVWVENRTNKRVYGRVELVSKGCVNWNFTIEPWSAQIDSSGKTTYPRWLGPQRGNCLVKAIHVNVGGEVTTFNVRHPEYNPSTNSIKGGIWAQSFASSGTHFNNFAVAPKYEEDEAYQVFRTDGDELVKDQGVDPGFLVKNETIWPVHVSLNQAGCLYHKLIQPGGSQRWVTGSVWFTMQAEISYDGQPKKDDWDCAQPIISIVGNVILGIVTAGGVSAAWATAKATVGQGAKTTLYALANPLNPALDVPRSLLLFTATQIGDAVMASSFGKLSGQYAGYAWPFRSKEIPTYKVSGGPKFELRTTDEGKEAITLVAEKLCITKINSVGDKMMKGSKKTSCQ